MSIETEQILKLKKINAALMERVERSTDQQGNAFSLFQTAINLDGQIRRRTSELTNALSRLEHTNSELNLAKEEAEQANLSKTRFLAAASHDVLQPLNAANLLLSALGEQQQTEKGHELTLQLGHSLETIDEVLRSLLDISRLDAGVVETNIKNFRMQDLFDSLESGFRPIAESRGLDLRFRATELAATSDQAMLRRILQNLISNALRYTDTGGVIVCCRKRREHLIVSVFDTGIGFNVDEASQLFEEFHRAVPKHLRNEETRPGLGLGLSIVSRMCKTLGHKLAFSSTPGTGSAFSIQLESAETIPAGDARTAHTAGTSRLQGVYGTRVLLLENDVAVIQAMLELLQQWHCEVRHGSTMEEAMDCLEDGWSPQIIIADQQLDDDDLGTTTIIELREWLAKRGSKKSKSGCNPDVSVDENSNDKQLPAIMITADPSEQLQQFTQSEDIELMLKPVKPAQLRALLTHVIAENIKAV